MNLLLKLSGKENEVVINTPINILDLENSLNTLNFITIGNSIITRGDVQYFAPENVESYNLKILLNTGKILYLYQEDYDINSVSSKLNKRQNFICIGGGVFNNSSIRQIDYIEKEKIQENKLTEEETG